MWKKHCKHQNFHDVLKRVWWLMDGVNYRSLKVLPVENITSHNNPGNICSGQSRTSLVLGSISCRAIFCKAHEALLLICRQEFESAGRNEQLSLNALAPYCFALLLIYHFYLNTGKKNVGGVLENFLFWILILWNIHHSSFSSCALLHEASP